MPKQPADARRARRQRAVELRASGWSYDRIAEELNISHGQAWHDVEQAYVDSIREPTEIVRSQELHRLDIMLEKALKIMNTDHFAVANGRIVTRRISDPDTGLWIILSYTDEDAPIYATEDVLDDGPALQAIQTLIKIMDRRAKLLGLDAPKRVEHLTLDMIDQLVNEAELALVNAEVSGEGDPS